MAVKCDHMPEVSCAKCDGWSEVARLEGELAVLEAERSNQVKRAEAAESDLRHSDAIRAAMIKASTETAGDALRAIELLEAAFHAGARYGQSDESNPQEGMGGVNCYKSIDQAFREWAKEHLKNEHRREPAKG